MKKSILTTIAAAFACIAVAQIPNNGFENWTNMGTYNDPDQWGTLNSVTSFSGVYTCTKGTPGSPGASYIKLVSKTVTGMGVVPGIAATGVLNMSGMTASGFAYALRPANLTGSWQYMASGADQGFISVLLSKWNGASRDTVASAFYALPGMAMSWAGFTIPLTYKSGGFPDTAIITLSASGNTPVANSYLYVDNLAFSGSVMSIAGNKGATINFSAFPNPAKNNLQLEITAEKANAARIQLIDLAGKTVSDNNISLLAGKNTRTLEVSGLAAGSYFIKISCGDFTEVKKVIIE